MCLSDHERPAAEWAALLRGAPLPWGTSSTAADTGDRCPTSRTSRAAARARAPLARLLQRGRGRAATREAARGEPAHTRGISRSHKGGRSISTDIYEETLRAVRNLRGGRPETEEAEERARVDPGVGQSEGDPGPLCAQVGGSMSGLEDFKRLRGGSTAEKCGRDGAATAGAHCSLQALIHRQARSLPRAMLLPPGRGCRRESPPQPPAARPLVPWPTPTVCVQELMRDGALGVWPSRGKSWSRIATTGARRSVQRASVADPTARSSSLPV